MAAAPPPPPPPNPTLTGPMPVIGPEYCVTYPVDLTVVEKLMTIADGSFTVLDINGNTIFTVKGKAISFHGHRVLQDTAGKPLATLRQNILSAHGRWNVYRGGSADSKDLICTVKRSSLIQVKPKLQVFLGSNTQETCCDFRIEGSFRARSGVIYLGTTNNIVAQMHQKRTMESKLIGKDSFGVTVYPYVDYALITLLVTILADIAEGSKK